MANSLVKRFNEIPIDTEFRWQGEDDICRKTDEYSYIKYSDEIETHHTAIHWKKVVLLAHQQFPVKQ